MDRYQIAIAKQTGSAILGYTFKPTRSVTKTLMYMKRCLQDGKMFFATNIDHATLDSAMILLSQENNVPIIVGSGQTAKTLSISHSHKKIYTKENFPHESYGFAIYYWDVSKFIDEAKPFLIIRR